MNNDKFDVSEPWESTNQDWWDWYVTLAYNDENLKKDFWLSLSSLEALLAQLIIFAPCVKSFLIKKALLKSSPNNFSNSEEPTSVKVLLKPIVWHLETIVGNKSVFLLHKKIKTVLFPGSSTVFKILFEASTLSLSASQKTTTLNWLLNDDTESFFIKLETLSTPIPSCLFPQLSISFHPLRFTFNLESRTYSFQLEV